MSLLDMTPTKAYYTNRLHYRDRTNRPIYRWTTPKYLDNFQALDQSTKLAMNLGLDSQVVLFQWNGKAWQQLPG